MKVLVTGGAGYIGSTVCNALLDRGHFPIVLDNFSLGKRDFVRQHTCYEGDTADHALLARIFADHPEIRVIIHCAALIVVPESTEDPSRYYHENVAKSLGLFDFVRDRGGLAVVFSSSASIYATVEGFRVTEDAPLAPASPYARTKYMMEMVLADFCAAYDMRGLALRYFNPIGADPELRSGMHLAEPSHVLSKLVNAALGVEQEFCITGTDWPTRDGTGIRDYIHIWDLARAHVLAAEYLHGDSNLSAAQREHAREPYQVINLGTGNGVTVRELCAAFQEVWDGDVPIIEGPPRPGDAAGAFADTTRARERLGWQAELSTADAIRSELQWRERRKELLGY
ncbi:UDP-glucose 4-epimerase GalE [Spirochaeta africana]|uniref:UDP-glucose 4-epimerase n=1 Tax=Spirochaeta africana (strain ATCC 700263 / DSM 8902 / Z-7692) TaxID=889378 RepID=H9ULN2_SPIAZ|nr:UDP-glucose 4-epimerase GalE [Spirochaeta africana]AFG38425.1 UDP-glucose-4-epimerase [Spirochaeta africana DSM 8902]